jgi:hypothetical protein
MIKQHGKYGPEKRTWIVTIERLKIRKTDEFGNPYDGLCDIIIVDEQVHVVGLMLQNPHSKANKSDLKSLREIIKDLGYDTFTYSN